MKRLRAEQYECAFCKTTHAPPWHCRLCEDACLDRLTATPYALLG